MKSIIPAVIIFLILTFMTSCSNSKAKIDETDQNTFESTVTSAPAVSHTQKKTTHTAAVTESVSETSDTPQTSVTTQTPDPESVEKSMLEEISDVDYNAGAAIPYVAWTEINLDKMMYTQLQCNGFEFALESANKKMLYDAGMQLHIIARTDTDYYRTDNDIYIPCSFLDNTVPDGADEASATSCTVYIPPVITTSVSQTTESSLSEHVS